MIDGPNGSFIFMQFSEAACLDKDFLYHLIEKMTMLLLHHICSNATWRYKLWHVRQKKHLFFFHNIITLRIFFKIVKQMQLSSHAKEKYHVSFGTFSIKQIHHISWIFSIHMRVHHWFDSMSLNSIMVLWSFCRLAIFMHGWRVWFIVVSLLQFGLGIRILWQKHGFLNIRFTSIFISISVL